MLSTFKSIGYLWDSPCLQESNLLDWHLIIRQACKRAQRMKTRQILEQTHDISAENVSGWCLTSGSIGHETQCLGLFDVLGIEPVIKRINPQGWYKKLAPIGPAAPHSEIIAPWPDLLIVAGRQSLPYARMIKRQTKGKTFVVVLQSPGLPSSWFNFIWVPEHDTVRGKNVLTSLTPPHLLSLERLALGAEKLEAKIRNLPRPLVTVLIGGSSRSYQFGENEAQQLCTDLIALHKKTGCSFLISPSYRTDKKLIDFFKQKLATIPTLIWEMHDENPYFGFLAVADYFIVTCDSVNMLGEAAFTGKPIYAYPVPGGQDKFSRFHHAMIEHGAMRWFHSELEDWTYAPLNATYLIAEEIKQRLAAHRTKLI